MIVAFLLLSAIQAAPPQGFTPAEQRAVVATMECQRDYLDSIPRRERRRGGEAVIEAAYAACAREEAALRALLATRFDARSVERALEMVRDGSREGMLRYIRR